MRQPELPAANTFSSHKDQQEPTDFFLQLRQEEQLECVLVLPHQDHLQHKHFDQLWDDRGGGRQGYRVIWRYRLKD